MGLLFFVRQIYGLGVLFGNNTIPYGACEGTRYNSFATHFVLRPSSERVHDEDDDEYLETGEKDGIFYRVCYLSPKILDNGNGTITYFWDHPLFSLSVTIPCEADVVKTMLMHYGYHLEFKNKQTMDDLPPFKLPPLKRT